MNELNQTITSGTESEEKAWFNKRPIPVFIIFALCALQFLGIALFLWENWREVVEPVQIGIESPLGFVVKFVYPVILLSAGFTLFFMRKAAIFLFGIYFAWGIGKIVVHTIDFPGYLSLVMVFGVLIYCFRLRQQGLLK